jgi:hypothetical protein
MDDGGRTKRILGGALVGLLLLGAGIGIGAAIWSGESSKTRTVAVTPASNDAPDPNASDPNAPDPNAESDEDNADSNGDLRVNAQVHFSGLAPQGATFSARQGQPTNCTKDETYGWWTVKDGGTQTLSMTAKMDAVGACAGEKPTRENTWDTSTGVGQGEGQLYIKVYFVPVSGGRGIWVKAPACRGWGAGWSCSAGKVTAADPQFTITAPK